MENIEKKSASTGKTKLKVNKLHVVLIALALISVLATGVTFSSYNSTSTGSSTVSIALFANDHHVVDIPLTDFAPGVTKEVPIEIYNYEGDKISEVSQRYTLTYELLMDRLPIQISLEEDEDNQATVSIEDGVATGDFNLNNGAPEAQSASFKLIITWPAEENDHHYSEEIDVVRVTIDSTQIN